LWTIRSAFDRNNPFASTFANKNLLLTPGLFARIHLQGAEHKSGCLAKDQAVVTDLNQKYVFVLGKNNTLT